MHGPLPFQKQGVRCSEFDFRLARYICETAGVSDPLVILAAALTNRAVAEGNVCLDLRELSRLQPPAGEKYLTADFLPRLADWRRVLASSAVVGRPGQRRPLILDAADRLYFQRYWEMEEYLAESILARVSEPVADIDVDLLRDGIHRLFGSGPQEAPNWQAVACISSIFHRFAVISGGPGTGKTTVVAMILALLVEQAGERFPRIKLAAPTGKAAARLARSVRAAKAHLTCRARVLAAIPETAATLHRLLGPIAYSPYFVYNQKNPLPCDVLVVDEASMVDVALMSRLCQALLPTARLILVGDRDQLASVEAGSVLGDICARRHTHGFSEGFANRVSGLTGLPPGSLAGGSSAGGVLADSIVLLKHSYRFEDAGGLGRLSRAVNSGDAARMWQSIDDPADATICWQPATANNELERLLAKHVIKGYRNCLKSSDPDTAIERLERFKIICALRNGPHGVAGINESARRVLAGAGLLPPIEADPLPWYRGRPVLVTKNDYSLGLFNGDMGIVLPDPSEASQRLYVFFPNLEGPARPYPPDRLGPHETAFALTVHKSQGSEFEDVLLVLPEHDSPVLTRELLYTAVTRARRSVTIYSSRPILESALQRRTDRTSGLRDRLWGGATRYTEETS